MTAVLVMIPAGEVYDHDCVRWYDYRNVQKSINHYHNIGDAFVYDSSLKLLNYDRLEVLSIENVVAADIDRLRNELVLSEQTKRVLTRWPRAPPRSACAAPIPPRCCGGT